MTDRDLHAVLESWRVRYAPSFAPRLAANAARVDPLPHQLHAVYDVMLPRQPLRMLLADDPGAGKTIMAGMLLTEHLARGRARRCLVVAPGSLVDQWRDELSSKFDLALPIAERAELRDDAWRAANPRVIVRLDQCARDAALGDLLAAQPWDLAIFDEAHRLSTSWNGRRQDRTLRFRFAQKLCRAARDVLLMSATPHDGDEEDFQAFLQLLDADRFEGKYRPGAHRVSLDDVVLRRVKEDLRRFDGTDLFPPRRASTLRFELSPDERALYDAVTRYVREQFDRADALDRERARTVGFALTVLQRRLASSPRAIERSLQARHDRLAARLLAQGPDAPGSVDEEDDDLAGGDAERRDDAVVEGASAARSRDELTREVATLRALAQQARAVLDAGGDRKREKLVELLNDPVMRDAQWRRRKLVIFTEHRDTLEYLTERLGEIRGRHECVRAIHGAMDRAARLDAQRDFTTRDEVEFLVATDAAGEGINLQCASLVLNWDIPWTPSKLEQRFGRVHRIGQRETCHLFSLVALGTRETEVLDALCRRLERETKSLSGKVFDVLGAAFDDRPLRDLLIDAVRQRGNARTLAQDVSRSLDEALARQGTFSQRTRARPGPFMAAGERRTLDLSLALGPGAPALGGWFPEALRVLGGKATPWAGGSWRVNFVPAAWRAHCPELPSRLTAWSLPNAAHPWLRGLADAVLDAQTGPVTGCWVDPVDGGDTAWWLVGVSQRLRVGDETLQECAWLAAVYDDGRVRAFDAPVHLDLRAPAEGEQATTPALPLPRLLAAMDESLAAPWRAAISMRHAASVDQETREASARLSAEIQHARQHLDASAQRAKSHDDGHARRVKELQTRLLTRSSESERARRVFADPLRCVCALRVIPRGQARTVVETARSLAAMRGEGMYEVRHARRGWDLEADDVTGALRGWVVRDEGDLGLRPTEVLALAQAPEKLALLVVPTAEDGRGGIPVEVRGISVFPGPTHATP